MADLIDRHVTISLSNPTLSNFRIIILIMNILDQNLTYITFPNFVYNSIKERYIFFTLRIFWSQFSVPGSSSVQLEINTNPDP